MKTSHTPVVTGIAILAAAVLGAVVSVPFGAHASKSESPTVVILVRHAEKAAEPADDPGLSPAGEARALALVAALRGAKVTAVITSQLRRTIESARPVAEARGVTPEVIPVEKGKLDAHVAAVAAAVRRNAGGVVLVVGHSNTIPAIIAALGGPEMPDICESLFANLYVLTLTEGEAVLVNSQYGAADAKAGPDCK